MKPVISIIMGSKSDWATMQKAAEVLDNFGVAYEKKVVSAHRTPDLMFKHAEEARSRGIKVIIAGAGGAAHLPGMVAAKQHLQSSGYQSNHVPLAVWIRFILSFRCQVVYQSQPWLSVKLVRLMPPLCPPSSLSRRQGHW